MVQCQRWRAGRESYRPAGEPIEPWRYRVELIDERQAKDFVATHHYAPTMPPARLRVGLFQVNRFLRPELVGVAVFSVPMQAAAVPRYLGVAQAEGVELGRLVLNDCVPSNGESFFVARANRLLEQSLPDVRGVLSYSDPVERIGADGRIVKRGHFGTVYRALSASYFGRSSPRTLVLDPRGRVLSQRSLSKLRCGESGAAGAYRQLLEAGAPPRRLGEDEDDYVRRALAEGPFRRMRHPGNLVFGWALGSATQRRRTRGAMTASEDYPPYPSEASAPAAEQRQHMEFR